MSNQSKLIFGERAKKHLWLLISVVSLYFGCLMAYGDTLTNAGRSANEESLVSPPFLDNFDMAFVKAIRFKLSSRLPFAILINCVKTVPGDFFNRDVIGNDLCEINALGVCRQEKLTIVPELNKLSVDHGVNLTYYLQDRMVPCIDVKTETISLLPLSHLDLIREVRDFESKTIASFCPALPRLGVSPHNRLLYPDFDYYKSNCSYHDPCLDSFYYHSNQLKEKYPSSRFGICPNYKWYQMDIKPVIPRRSDAIDSFS